MTDEKVFIKYYKQLNSEQKKAVDTIEGPVMVVAGPGTGKTQILTLRIANILRQTDVAPEQILALTFTKSGVYAMRKRLVEIIGSRGYKVNIHTFHSFCNDIIAKFPEEFSNIIGANPATRVDQIDILSVAILNEGGTVLKSFGDPLFYLKATLSEIERLKRENINPDDLFVLVQNQESEFLAIPDLCHDKGVHKGKMKGKYQTEKNKIDRNKQLVNVYREYENLLRQKKLYDFGDMIMEVIKRLKDNGDFLLQIQEEFQYILADEHQDANGAQNNLLELLSSFHDNPNLFIVGDEKQAIYQFQGASLDNFNYFKSLYPEARIITLVANYRSVQKVLDSAHSVITKSASLNNLNIQNLEAKAYVDREVATFLYHFSEEEYELRFVAEKVKNLIDAGQDPKEIAVLYRNNKDAHKLTPFLDRLEVSYTVESDEDILTDIDISKLLKILRSAESLDENELLQIIHFSIFNLPRLEVYKVINEVAKKHQHIGDVIKSETSKDLVADSVLWRDWWERVETWNTQAKNDLLLPTLEKIINESGFLNYLIGLPDSLFKIEKLRRLLDEAKLVVENNKEANLGDFIKHLDVLLAHNLPLEAKSLTNSAGVRLMTAHRSKGLEFDQVFIIGVRDGHWGNKRSISYFSVPNRGSEVVVDSLDDDRRLFYVGLTRARRGVHISFSDKNRDDKNFLPSQFIEEIDVDLVKEVDVSKFINKYENDPTFILKENKNINVASLEDKNYLQEIFKQRGLSVTALNNYLECPWKYFFKNLIRLPDIRNKNALYGTAIHDALERFFNLYKDRGELPPKATLLSLFDNALLKQPLSEEDFKEVQLKGQIDLDNYYDLYQNNWINRIITEYGVRMLDIEGGVPLTGKLDKVEILDSGLVNVVDYKTSKPKSRNEIEGLTKNSAGNFKRQLVFYKLLLEKTDDSKFKMESAEIDFIQPNDRGVYKKEKFIIEEGEVGELEVVVKKTINEILNLDFWSKNCGKKDCEFCKLREVLK